MTTVDLDKKAKESNEDVSLKELVLKLKSWFKYLFSKWLVVLIAGFLGAGIGLMYAYSKKPVYTATTTFVLEAGDGGGGLGQYAGLASMVEKTLLSEVKFEDRKELLVDRYIRFNKLRESWSKRPELKNIQFAVALNSSVWTFNRLQDSVLGTIVNDINKNYLNVLKPDKKLSIIEVDVRAKDEEFAEKFNVQIQKADSVRSVMNGAIYAAAAIADATPNLNPTRQIQRIAPVQKSQFSAESNKAILGELVKNLELARISLRKEMPLIQTIDQPVFPLKKEQLGKIKGLVLGGFIFGVLTVLFLLLKKMFSEIMK
eukprot:gene4760-5547_t